MKDVSKFGVVSVTKKHCSTSLVNEVELQAHIPQESKPGVTLQLTRKTIVDFQPKIERRVRIHGSDILPDGNIVYSIHATCALNLITTFLSFIDIVLVDNENLYRTCA